MIEPTPLEVEALRALGYVEGDDIPAAITRFRNAYFPKSPKSVEESMMGAWDEKTRSALAERMAPTTCGVADIQRANDGSIIAEARWPPSCADIQMSTEFNKAPGLTVYETLAGILFNIAQWNTAFDSPVNGRWYPELTAEYERLCKQHSVPLTTQLYVLWIGTVTHEVGHALGLNHTPNDRDSVLYPSMGGQFMLNSTDIRNLEGRGYSKSQPIKLSLVEWKGTNGTQIWARLGTLSGSTLAWSMLSNGRCDQKAEQRYDTRRDWSDRAIELPDFGTPDTPPTPTPGDDIFDGVRVHFETDAGLYGPYRIIRQ